MFDPPDNPALIPQSVRSIHTLKDKQNKYCLGDVGKQMTRVSSEYLPTHTNLSRGRVVIADLCALRAILLFRFLAPVYGSQR